MAKMPFIAMSTHPAPLNMFMMARALGARIALQKPFSAQQLNEAIETILNARSAPSLQNPNSVRVGNPMANNSGGGA